MTTQEDFLTADQSLPGQNYVCLSFVSPEKELEDKHLYYLWKYAQETFKVSSGFSDFKEDFLNYEYREHNAIEKEFYELNDFRTTVRGLKVRGVFDTRREAEVRSKVLRRLDPSHHIYIGQVGFWLPWDPKPDDVAESEYQESQLNELMKKKLENEQMKNMHWEEEKRKNVEHMKKKAEEARKKKEEEENQAQIEDVTTSESNEKNDTNDTNAPDSSNTTPVDSGLQGDDPWMQRKREQMNSVENVIKKLDQ